MANGDESKIPNAGPEPGTEHAQRKDEASGQRVGPPGTGERDEDAIAKGSEQLERVEAGH